MSSQIDLFGVKKAEKVKEIKEVRGAKFSVCRHWRYSLWRVWDPDKDKIIFIGLNPSTADENVDDATMCRLRGFSKSWDYGGFIMLNLFGYRSTDPRALKQDGDIIGPDNDKIIKEHISGVEKVVCCWGAHGALGGRSVAVIEMIKSCKVTPWCFGITGSGEPLHPLYLASDSRLGELKI